MNNKIEKEKKPRKKTIKLRLDDDVYNFLEEQKVLRKCLTWNDLIISLKEDQKGRKKVLVDENGSALKYINHLVKIGNNLNQIAKTGNINKQFNSAELKDIRKFSTTTKQLKDYFCRKVIPNFKIGSK